MEKRRLRNNVSNAQLVHDGKGAALEQEPCYVEKSPSLVMLKTHWDKALTNLIKF